MSDIIESIKQSAGQVLSGLDQKGQIKSAIDGIRAQWSELERRRKKGQIESELKAMQTEARQLSEALGLQTLSLFDAGKIAHPELARLCERINELRSEIDRRKELLASLEAQARAAKPTRCPVCQASVPGDSEFCPKCGARLATGQAAPAARSAPASRQRTVVRLRCPRCKTELPADTTSCPTCGVRFKPPATQVADKRYCASCGAEVKAASRFCPICGQSIG